MSYRKILLIADPSMQITPAYRRAERLARVSGAALHIELFDDSRALRAIGAMSSKIASVLRMDMIKQRQLWLYRRREHLMASGVTAHVSVNWGAPVHQRILERIEEVRPDLVVKDVHHERLLKRVLFTPLDWQLLRQCPVPLLMVRGGVRKMPRRVIAAVDTAHPLPGSDRLNERIVAAAEKLAAECGAAVHLVHAFEDLLPVVPAEVMSPEAFGDAYERLREIHRERFSRFAQAHGIAKDRRHFLYGPPAYALSEFATHSHTDVLVVGTTHRTGLDRFMLGSTAEEILDDLRCDVLAVGPPPVPARQRVAPRKSQRGKRQEAAALSVG